MDQDSSELIALLLAEEERLFAQTEKSSIDTVEPCPDIRALFLQFDREHFNSTLGSVEVKWSSRMTLCAGLCEYRRGGYCVIKLSEKLLRYRSQKELFETLLVRNTPAAMALLTLKHEMIHAYLFITRNNKDRDGHGPEFQKHMNKINAFGYNITIYHSFTNEVSYFRTHHWKCQGKCGIVIKRSMNRAPALTDRWWPRHEKTCGGPFLKIKEPEKKPKKEPQNKRKREGDESKLTKPKKQKKEPKEPKAPKGKKQTSTKNFFDNALKLPKPKAESTLETSQSKIPKKEIASPPKQLDLTNTIDLLQPINISTHDPPHKQIALHETSKSKIHLTERVDTHKNNTNTIVVDLTTNDPLEEKNLLVSSFGSQDQLNNTTPLLTDNLLHRTNEKMVTCPVCSLLLEESQINRHLDQCLQ